MADGRAARTASTLTDGAGSESSEKTF